MKKFLATVLAGIMMIGCAACSSTAKTEEKPANDAENGETKGLKDFDIVLDWYPNAVHTFLYVGIEKGYYEEEGIDLHIQFPAGANDAISLPAAGKADAGLFYQPSIVQTAAEQDVPVRAIGTVVQHPLNVVLSMTESGIKGPKDLVGKTVGYCGKLSDEAFLRAMLEKEGYTIDDINLIDVGFDLNAALITGNVDATIGGYINHEYPTLIQEGYDVSYFNLTDGGIPDYEELVVVTGQKQIDEEADVLEAFIRASKKAFEDVKNDPEGSLEILLKNQDEANYPLNAEIEKASMEILLPLMVSDERDFLEIDKENWQASIDWLGEHGLIEKEVTLDDVLGKLN